MVTLAKLMHSLLHHETEDADQGSRRPIGMTARESAARELEEAKPVFIAEIVGYSGF